MIEETTEKNFANIISNIKKDIVNTRNKLRYTANTELINM